MPTKLIGFDQKAKKWCNTLFSAAFEAGVRDRIAAGIREPTSESPEAVPPAPHDYIGANAKRLWASGWSAGYALAMRETPKHAQIACRRATEWQRALDSRRTILFDRHKLAKCWRGRWGKDAKFLHLASSGSLTGAALKDKVLHQHVVGTWRLEGDCLVLDYKSNVYGGEKDARYRVCNVIMHLTPKTLKLATDQNQFERYSRVPRMPRVLQHSALTRSSLLGQPAASP